MSNILTPIQLDTLDVIKASPFITDNFYFSGGTALSEYYLQHRYSEDLDFFSEQDFNEESVLAVVQKISQKLGAPCNAFNVESTYIYNFRLPDGTVLKTDFSYYPYKPLGDFTIDGKLKISSKLDIAVNKSLVVGQRTDVKDFVDLYFLLEEYAILDLLHEANRKFHRDYDMMFLASDFTKAKSFKFLPRMIKPLTLDQLQAFYTDWSQKLGIASTIE